MNIRKQIFLLSSLSMVALTTVSEATTRNEFNEKQIIRILPRKTPVNKSQTEQPSESSISLGASYNGPLTVQERQVEHVLAAVDALVNKNISSIFIVLNRSSIDKHPVYANQALHHLYEVAMPTAVQKMRNATKQERYKRRAIPSFEAKGREPSVLNTAQTISIRKPAIQEVPPLAKNDEELSVFAKNKNRIIKTITSLVRF